MFRTITAGWMFTNLWNETDGGIGATSSLVRTGSGGSEWESNPPKTLSASRRF